MSEVMGDVIVPVPSKATGHGQIVRAFVRREENFKHALHISRFVFQFKCDDRSARALAEQAIELALSKKPAGDVSTLLAEISWELGCPVCVIEADCSHSAEAEAKDS